MKSETGRLEVHHTGEVIEESVSDHVSQQVQNQAGKTCPDECVTGELIRSVKDVEDGFRGSCSHRSAIFKSLRSGEMSRTAPEARALCNRYTNGHFEPRTSSGTLRLFTIR